MESENIIEKVNRLIAHSKWLKEQNDGLMNENTTLKAQNEVKDSEISRLHERLSDRERELDEVAREIDTLLGA